jgi:ACT domain-containing protein
MKMNLVLELQDVPGQLVSVLEPISGLGTNLVTVIHQRDSKNEKGMIPVQITIEGERDNLKQLIEKLTEMNITILEMDGVVLKEKLTTILIGHVIDSDIKDTMDQINLLEGVSVVGLDVKLEGELESSAMIVVESDAGKKEIVLNKILEIANGKDLLVVNEV